MKQLDKIGAEAVATKGFLKAHQWLILRRITQIATMALFMLGPLAGIWIVKGNLASSLILDTVPLSEPLLILQTLAAGFVPLTTMVLGTVIVVLFYMLVGGRVYCSWFCPINIVTDSANWLRERMRITGTVSFSRKTRYWILLMVVVLPLFTGTMAYESVNPVPVVHRGIIFGAGMAWSIALAIFLFDLFIQRKGWCGHLCPMGALYAIIGKASLLRVRADNREACDDCMECFAVCPEPQVIKPALKGTDLGNGPVIDAGACTNCGRCIDICAEDVFHFGLRHPN